MTTCTGRCDDITLVRHIAPSSISRCVRYAAAFRLGQVMYQRDADDGSHPHTAQHLRRLQRASPPYGRFSYVEKGKVHLGRLQRVRRRMSQGQSCHPLPQRQSARLLIGAEIDALRTEGVISQGIHCG